MGKAAKTSPIPKKTFILWVASLALFLVIFFIGAYLFLQNRIYPAIFISNLNLTGKTPFEAQQDIDSLVGLRTASPLTFSYKNQTYSIDLSSLQSSIQPQRLISTAFLYGHTKPYFSP